VEGYNGLNNTSKAFTHLRVNHSQGFINRETGVNTQAIESLWGRLKLKVKQMKGCQGDKIDSYLKEWMFKEKFKINWLEVINLIKLYY